MLRWLKRRKRSAASVGILTAAAVALGVMAFTYPGFTTTNVDMHDGGVWVTKNDASLLGHINQQAGELDAGLTVASSDFDVLQYDGDVLLKDNANVALDAVNTGAASLTGQVPIPPGASVSLRGGTVTILDPVDGRLWAMPVSSLAQFSSEETQPLAELGTGSAAVADETGGVQAVSSANGTWQSWQSTAEGFALQTETERPELREATDLTITSVGDKAAALDQAHGVLLLLDARVDVPAGAVLQQPGEASQNVIVATPESLITQPLDGSAAVIDDLAPGTSAVAPVQVDECVYSVSTGDMTLTRACSDPARDLQEVVTDVDAGSIVFREHRGVVALNDVQQGVSWLVSDQLIMVDNWQDLIPPQSEEETEEEDDSSSEDVLDNRTPDDAEENSDPVANDDTLFGARRGLSTLVPVTHNDTDPDGDLLTVSLVDEAPGGVRISPVQNYTQFQVEIPADYGNSSLTFEYEVNDGRGGTDQARVTLQLRDETQNEAPAELREQSFEVEQRATYEHSVLDGWFDPDGDDVYLLNAWSESGDTVQFAPNGRVNYTATGEVGPTELFVEITDGTEVTEGVIKVMVSERGEGKPLANADYVALGENSRASIRPMANDFIPGGGKAWVASVTSRDGSVQATLDRSTNTVVLESASAGVHFVDYVLGAGPFSAQGTIRVDVLEPVEDAQPVAVRDLALLPVGGEALIDLTENDVDPTGGVLVVQSVMVDGAPVSTKLINRNLLRIEDNRGALEPMTIQYSVSNGSDEATGEISIVPVPPPTKPRPPVGVDDTATLREGDFVSVDVTDNDFSPDGLAFSVSPEIVETSLAGPEEGSVFVDGDKVRVHVLVGGPSAVDVTYEIVDAQGNKGTATLTVAVERRDAESNAPPVPKEVTARVLAGSTIRIPIPLDGIDPDGDGVTLVGYDTNPEQGRIENVGPDYFDYEAFDADGGTTVFQYRVRDRWGAESVSSITVGIAQPGAINQAPVAETDTVTVRPGRSVAVAVLDNDTDPDGDNIVLTGVDAESADGEIQGLQLSEDGSHVVFTAPESEGEWQVPYSIEDVRGMPQTGTVRIVVSETAPLIAPSAVDDSVEVTDLVEGEPFDVDVLANDRDADGDPAELEVSVVTGPATVSSGQVQVVPSETWQVVTYRVTDIDGGSSEAFVFVPGVGKQPPHLAGNAEVTVPSGELAEIRLIDYVVMPQGGSPRITTTESVSATNANGDELVIDESTLAYTSELGYVGKAAITFEVSDGEGPDDPDALTARLSIPINVIPSSQVKPTFNGLAIQVEPAEDAVEYDLKPHTRDPDEGDVDAMEYALGDGGGQGVHAEVRGQSFIASADADVPAGTTVTYQIMLTDPAGNDVPGTVQVQVVTSTRELAQAVADTAETEQGVEVTIPAIGNDVNPFADRGEPLEIVSVRTVAGDVEGAPSTDGASVSVVPGGDFAGTLTLQYTVQDATKSESRQVTGTISVNVKGRPDAPVRPNVNAIGDSEVTLSWAAPSSNGAPITGYLVEYSGESQACESTTCTVSGLTNDTTYNFTVRAINEVGESDPSAASIDARPDVRPEQPEAPTATRGDLKLDVSWEAPANKGSAIESYVLKISPVPSDGRLQVEVPGGTTTYTWDGLTNGTEYRFSVQAVNRADEPSDFSPESSGTIPAGKPTAPTSVTASATQLGGDINQVVVSWGKSDGNGVDIEHYTVTPMQNGSPVNGVAPLTKQPSGAVGETEAATFEGLPVSETPYSFKVVATNEVGDSQPAASNELRAVNPPDAPRVSLVENGDTFVIVNITPGSRNGYGVGEVEYEWSASGSGSGLTSTGQNVRIENLTNGSQALTVTAVANAGSGLSARSPDASISINPYGLPAAPNVSVSQQNTNSVVFTWSAGSDNGSPITGYRWRQQGTSAWNTVGGVASPTIDGSPGDSITIEVQAQNKAGWSGTATATGKVKDPTPTLTVIGGGQRSDAGQTGELLVLQYANLTPGTYGVVCMQMRNGQLQAFGQSATTPYSVTTSNSSGTTGVNPDEIKCFSNNSEGVALQLVSGPSVDQLGVLTSTVNYSWPP